MKSMSEMLKLMEGVMAVPGVGSPGGTESDMQTAGTVGRDQAYSEFDSAQPAVTEEYSDSHIAGWLKRAIADAHPIAMSPEELKSLVASETGYGEHPRFNELFDKAYRAFYALDMADNDSDGDYTDWSMRQGEMGKHAPAVSEKASPSEEVVDEDLNNGYDDVQYANGQDYFPNGADGPVVKATGPSGARQGDNPEQKKMQIDELHKELVYGYRKYLKEGK